MTWARAILLSASLAAVFVSRSGHAEDPPLGRVDYSPYRVAVSVSFAADPLISPAFRQNVVATFTTRIVQTFGATWDIIPSRLAREESWLTPANEDGLQRLTFATAADHLKGMNCDKAFFLVAARVGSHWRIAGREWDGSLQSLGPLKSVSTIDRRGLPDASLELVKQLFCPLVLIDDADRDSKTAKLTIRAGSIPLGDPNFSPLAQGAILLPVLRFVDAKHQVRKVQPLPWTYLVLTSLDKGHATGAVASTYRAPLAANMRRRVEALAVLLRPDLPETHLHLSSGKGAHRPLAGIYALISPEPLSTTSTPAKDSRKEPASPKPRLLLSDRNGIVRIAADLQHPLQQLEIRSGSVILARRPFLPGVEADVNLDLPDDSLRLDTEREIDLLRGQLIETVARRAAFLGRARASAKKNDLESVRQILAEIERLPSAGEYESQLNKIRVIAVEDARRRKDRLAERRIDELCQKSLQLVEQYLPQDRIRTLKDEYEEALKEQKAQAEATVAKARQAAALKKAASQSKTKPRPKSSQPASNKTPEKKVDRPRAF